MQARNTIAKEKKTTTWVPTGVVRTGVVPKGGDRTQSNEFDMQKPSRRI